MNIKDYIKIENLIGVGCSRAVYKANNKVIKINLSYLGYLQTKVEKWFYDIVQEKFNRSEMFNKVDFINNFFSISDYIEPISNEYFDITCSDIFNESYYFDYEDDVIDLAKEFGICTDDWFSASNRAVLDGKLILIDYGMKKSFYPLIEKDDFSDKSKEEVHNYVLRILKEFNYYKGL